MQRWADCDEDEPSPPPPSPRTTSNSKYLSWLRNNPCTQRYLQCLQDEREWTRLDKAQQQALRQSAVPWEKQPSKQGWRRGAPPMKQSYDSVIKHATLFAPKSDY